MSPIYFTISGHTDSDCIFHLAILPNLTLPLWDRLLSVPGWPAAVGWRGDWSRLWSGLSLRAKRSRQSWPTARRPRRRSGRSKTHLMMGAWIAEWNHTRLWTLVCCAMSLHLGDDKLFIGPKNNINAFSWFYLVYLIWYHYLSVQFVTWIVKQKARRACWGPAYCWLGWEIH